MNRVNDSLCILHLLELGGSPRRIPSVRSRVDSFTLECQLGPPNFTERLIKLLHILYSVKGALCNLPDSLTLIAHTLTSPTVAGTISKEDLPSVRG